MKYHVVRCPDCDKLSIQYGNWFGCDCGKKDLDKEQKKYPVGKYCLNHFATKEEAEKLLKYVKKHDEKTRKEATLGRLNGVCKNEK
jgi:FPC/CPF motif-containing protein YcgG